VVEAWFSTARRTVMSQSRPTASELTVGNRIGP